MYSTIQQLKDIIDPGGEITWTDADDANLELALQAATAWIDDWTGLSFAATSATKYYTAKDTDLIFVEDLLTVTTLKTDDDGDGTYETTWDPTDYILEPKNGSPKRYIRIDPNGDYDFPAGVRYGVEIVGSWGTATEAPSQVQAACLLLAHRLWKRHDTIFGVAGTPALGVTIIQAKITADADIIALLDLPQYRRLLC